MWTAGLSRYHKNRQINFLYIEKQIIRNWICEITLFQFLLAFRIRCIVRSMTEMLKIIKVCHLRGPNSKQSEILHEVILNGVDIRHGIMNLIGMKNIRRLLFERVLFRNYQGQFRKNIVTSLKENLDRMFPQSHYHVPNTPR